MEKNYSVEFDKGCVEYGESSYIKELFARAKCGEELTLAFLGGSITQDAVTSDHKLCYAYRVYDWFCKTFPNAKFTYINAGIGATDSEFAAARVKEHVLNYSPDFVLMEHAVNDICTEHYKETYEGVVRQILTDNPSQALLTMCNVYYNNGDSAELMHRRIARHYNLPAVSMRPTIFDALLCGRFDNREITHDDLHPNDDGHGLVARVITTYLDKILSEMNSDTIGDTLVEKYHTNSRDIPAPLTANRYEHSVKYDNRNLSIGDGILISSNGFEVDTEPQLQVRDCFKNGFIATAKGSRMELEVEGSCIAIQFRRTINLPAPVAKCVIDDEEEKAIILDANFDETWGDKLELMDVYEAPVSEKHKVSIEIIEDHPDDLGNFYLAGVIVSGT